MKRLLAACIILGFGLGWFAPYLAFSQEASPEEPLVPLSACFEGLDVEDHIRYPGRPWVSQNHPGVPA
jgi:hypothetical protein